MIDDKCMRFHCGKCRREFDMEPNKDTGQVQCPFCGNVFVGDWRPRVKPAQRAALEGPDEDEV